MAGEGEREPLLVTLASAAYGALAGAPGVVAQLKAFDDAVKVEGGALLALAAATLVLAAIVALLFAPGGSRGGSSGSRGPTVLLVGPCGSGKTALAHRLCYDNVPQTVTSMKANTLRCETISPPCNVVDLPGHSRLRSQLHGHLGKATRIVFVVDVANMSEQLRPAAELLYDIFSDPAMDGGAPLLVACNKSDLSLARNPQRVKVQLQQEIDKLRGTRRSLETSGDDDDEAEEEKLPVGTPGQAFSMARDAPCEVTFAATSSVTPSLEEVVAFIEG
mmetsp:Transcript_8054/g.27396  ORF Transcript_8054/g.27396 Transcript_8054/m.27396 type:complete len:276 (-) Transcript_8054:36-863(-)